MFSDFEFEYGNLVRLTCVDGNVFEGVIVDIEIDYDGSFMGDSVELRLEDGSLLSFLENDVALIEQV
jgi:hypothetical protein